MGLPPLLRICATVREAHAFPVKLHLDLDLGNVRWKPRAGWLPSRANSSFLMRTGLTPPAPRSVRPRTGGIKWVRLPWRELRTPLFSGFSGLGGAVWESPG